MTPATRDVDSRGHGGPRRSRAGRGQALTEMALIAPVLALMLLGAGELAAAIGAKMALQAATAHGARIGALLGTGGLACVPPAAVPVTNTVDLAVLNAVTTTAGLDPQSVQQIQIYKAAPDGSIAAAGATPRVNTYTPSGAFTTPTPYNWPSCRRNANEPADSIGVHVSYVYHPFVALPWLSSITMNDQSVQRLNPSQGSNPCPIPGAPLAVSAAMADATHDQVTWNVVPGATSYNMYANVSGVNGNQFGTTPIYTGAGTAVGSGQVQSTVVATATTLYEVSASNFCGEGDRSLSGNDGRSGSTPTPTNTATPTATSTPANTATPTATSTPANTATPTLTATLTATTTPAPGATATKTATPVPGATTTATLVPTATSTVVPGPSATSTATAAAGSTATATPGATPSVSITSASAAPGTIARGSTESFSATIVANAALSGAIVDFEVYNSANAKIYQGYQSPVTFAATVAQTFTATWAVPAGQATGTYTLKVGVFGSGWAPLYVWNNAAASFTVTAPLGYTSVGASVDTSDSNYMNGSKITTGAQAVTLSAISAYVNALDPAPANDKFSVAVYSDNNGSPGTLVAQSGTGTLMANAWNTLPVSAALAANTSYWLMYNTNGSTTGYNNMSYVSGASNVGAWGTPGQPFGSWPTSFGPTTLATTQFSLYASVY